MKYVYDINEAMRANNLMLVYHGEFTQEITKSVLSMAESNLESLGEELSIKRRVFNVMVECLQNIVKHSDSIPPNHQYANAAIFLIGREEDRYIIISGNAMSNKNVEGLKVKLEQINGLNKDELKTLYREIIKTTTLSEKGGAGLGFVDMARKSGHNLEFSFEPIDSGHSFFVLKSVISKTK